MCVCVCVCVTHDIRFLTGLLCTNKCVMSVKQNPNHEKRRKKGGTAEGMGAGGGGRGGATGGWRGGGGISRNKKTDFTHRK